MGHVIYYVADHQIKTLCEYYNIDIDNCTELDICELLDKLLDEIAIKTNG